PCLNVRRASAPVALSLRLASARLRSSGRRVALSERPARKRAGGAPTRTFRTSTRRTQFSRRVRLAPTASATSLGRRLQVQDAGPRTCPYLHETCLRSRSTG